MQEHIPSGFFTPVRYMAALCILLGGSMHALAMALSLADGHSFPWWWFGVFFIAIPGYAAGAIFILKNHPAGYILALAGPVIGGTLIFFGFVFPQSGLLSLIPGTLSREITLTGFITLITEPIAAALSALCLWGRAWRTA